jgi:predicted dithiol-disulfide oxidoreductase (DUF899 family)
MTAPSQQSIEEELGRAEEELTRCREKIAQLRKQLAQPAVQDYTFTGPNNAQVTLSSLFGEKDDLLLIHNMGASCVYCTLWADGFNGVLPHLQDRTAFVVISPDDPKSQERFAQQRGWRFPMFSSKGTTFREDMGFQSGEEVLPGVSVFHKNADGSITHVSHAPFGPGDDYCAVWHLFDLLPEGSNEWEPKFRY